MSKTDLELQFDTITPQNLKDNETISKLLEIYNSSFAGAEEIAKNPLALLDTDFLINKYEETSNTKFDDIRKEIFKIHLQEIYETFDNIGDSEEIFKKFAGVYKALNVPVEQLKIVADIDKSITSEYLDAAGSFKTKKGTRSGFFFVYDIINRAGIQAINADEFFNLIEGTKEQPDTPFEYTVETSLYKEVFNKTVVPLAHPVGFNWNFIRLLFLTMEDYFGLEQIKTLSDTTLTCYGSTSGALAQQEIVKSGIYGTVKNFNATVDQHKKEGVIIDYNPLDGTEGDGLRLVKQFDGRVVLYDRQLDKAVKENGQLTGEIQYLEITDVRVVQEQNGILEINKVQRTLMGETFEVIDSISFKEYTIIDKEFIDIEFKIRGDFPDKWNPSRLYFGEKTVSENVKFFEPVIFNRTKIFNSSSSYNGRIVEDKGTNCLLNYKATYSYKVSTKDITGNVERIRPTTVHLAKDTRDIDIPQSEVEIARNEGRDPYEGLYASHDHTIEEINYYDTGDNWARLDYGNYKLTGNIGDSHIDPKFNRGHLAPEIVIDEVTEEVTYIPDGEITDLTIGGDWILADNDTHEFDKGFNSNAKDGARWEQYYRPLSSSDLGLISDEVYNSLTPELKQKRIQQYERENTEWYGNPLVQWNSRQNNNEYTAWESKTDNISINVFHNQEEFNLDKTPFFEIELGVDGNEKVQGSEVKIIINEGTDDEEIVTKTDKDGNPVVYLATVYVQREATFHDINYRPTINTPADGLQYVDGQEEENYENNQKYKISAGLVDADPVNLQLETTEQIYIKQYIPFKDAWTRDGNNLSLFNYRDLAEAEAGDVPVVDFTDMDDTWNTDYEVFGVNGLVNRKTGEVQNEGDYLETKHNTDTWTVFSKQEYSYETFEEWFIGDEDQNIGEIYVDGQGYYELVDADIYRGMWSFRENHKDFRKFETFDFKEKKDLGVDVVAEDNTITDEDGEIKSMADDKKDSEYKHVFDEFYKGELTDLNIGDFDINGEVHSNNRSDDRPASIGYEYMYKDEFGFGIGFNLITTKEEYCYDTMENWTIGDEDDQYIGCTFIDGKPYHEEVQAEIFRAQWNFNEFIEGNGLDFTKRNPEFEKYENFDFSVNPIMAEHFELDEDDINKRVIDEFVTLDAVIHSEHITEEFGEREEQYNTTESILLTPMNRYCYDTFENWNIEDDQENIGECTYIDGKGHSEDVEAEIYRAQWNFNYYTNNNELNSGFEKFEISNFTFMPNVTEIFGELQEPANDTKDYKVLEDDVAKDWHDLRIDDFDIGGEHDNPETNSSRKVFIGYEYMFQDAANIGETILGTPETKYTYNTFITVYIGDELNIADDEDYIDGKGVNIDIEADLYRGHWNEHDDKMTTEDNVITEKYEIYGMKVYKKDDDDNWVYLPDNNIDAAD